MALNLNDYVYIDLNSSLNDKRNSREIVFRSTKKSRQKNWYQNRPPGSHSPSIQSSPTSANKNRRKQSKNHQI